MNAYGNGFHGNLLVYFLGTRNTHKTGSHGENLKNIQIRLKQHHSVTKMTEIIILLWILVWFTTKVATRLELLFNKQAVGSNKFSFICMKHIFFTLLTKQGILKRWSAFPPYGQILSRGSTGRLWIFFTLIFYTKLCSNF